MLPAIERKEAEKMKDFIVLIAILVLGVAIAMIVLGFRSNMSKIGENATGELQNITDQLTNG